MVEGVTVPKRYQYRMRNSASKEYKLAALRDFIRNNQGKPLSLQEIGTALGYSNPGRFINILLDQGVIRRERQGLKGQGQKGGIGYKYVYFYVSDKMGNGPVITHDLGLPESVLGQRELTYIDQLFVQWLNNEQSGEQVLGANNLRKYVHAEVERVQREREAQLSQ